jgi:hypothetical protein
MYWRTLAAVNELLLVNAKRTRPTWEPFARRLVWSAMRLHHAKTITLKLMLLPVTLGTKKANAVTTATGCWEIAENHASTVTRLSSVRTNHQTSHATIGHLRDNA